MAPDSEMGATDPAGCGFEPLWITSFRRSAERALLPWRGAVSLQPGMGGSITQKNISVDRKPKSFL